MVATIDVQDEDKIAILAVDDEATLTEDEIGNPFQGMPQKRTRK